MEKTVTLLFSLINYSLFGRPLAEADKEPLTEEALERLYALADKHDLAHLAGDALYKNQLLPKGSAAAGKFQQAQVIALYRYTRMEHERKQICRVFEEAKIPYVPLKGIIIRPLYPQPYLRTSCDIDILIHKEDLTSATEQLKSHLQYTGNNEMGLHDISLFSSSGVHLELHFSLESPYDFLSKPLSNVWDYCSPVAEGRMEHRQSPEFFLFYHITHMITHFLDGGCGIRPLIDLALLRQKMPYKEDLLVSMCVSYDIDTFYEQAKRLCEVWFGQESHTDVTLAMEQYILYGGVYGTHKNNLEVRQQRYKSNFAYIMSRIFMPYDQLKNRYPVLKKHKWLYPVMTVRRWFNLIVPWRRKRALNELSSSAERFDSAKEGVAVLLADLKLK